MTTGTAPQDEKHVQGKKPKAPQRDKQHQAENPDRRQPEDGRQQGSSDIERNFEDQAR
jgi:hypothetical protein